MYIYMCACVCWEYFKKCLSNDVGVLCIHSFILLQQLLPNFFFPIYFSGEVSVYI